jgi:hypothetical protein
VEATRAEIPSDPAKPRRDAAAESRRPQSTLVAIHVEVRHPTGDTEPTARVIDAHVSEVDDPDGYTDPAPVDADFELFSEPAQPLPASNAVFALPARTSEAKQTRPGGVLRYLSARALSAYLTQHTLGSATAREPRLLDLRV